MSCCNFSMVIASAMQCSGGRLVGNLRGDQAAQELLVDLVGAGERHAVEEKHASRMTESRAIVEREGLDIVFAGKVAGAQHDERVGHLALHFVVERQYYGLLHGRMAFEQR